MRSQLTESFRKQYRKLPPEVRQQARKAYRQFMTDPYYRSLQFKQVHPVRPIYSARISRDYRVIGERSGDLMTWFWIGSHDDYDTLLKRFR